MLVSFVLGTLVGAVQALRLSRRADTITTVVTTVLYAAPSFWLALALVTLFTSGVVWLGLPSWARLPAFGMQDPSIPPTTMDWMDRWRHALLPLAVLAVPGAAGVARYARRAIREASTALHVRAALARGLSQRDVDMRHVLRNALTPLVVLFGLTLPGVIAGSVFVEQLFAWPGLGRTMLSAIAGRDYPVVMGLTLVYAAAVISANLLADIVLVQLDARRRT
jgi:peptide/nickel transport system permease protein